MVQSCGLGFLPGTKVQVTWWLTTIGDPNGGNTYTVAPDSTFSDIIPFPDTGLGGTLTVNAVDTDSGQSASTSVNWVLER
jgi:hypothetical protein